MNHAVLRKRPWIERLENRTLLTSVVVNSFSDTDTGVVTLRDAVTIANASTDPTTITFDPTVFAAAQTIVLAGSQLALTNTAEPTTIIGPALGVTVGGNNTSRVLEVYENVTASLTGVNITDGNSFGDDGDGTGGGVFNVGNLTFSNANITGNKGQAGGGGINNSSKLTLTNVTISNNTAGDHGGGLENFGARLGNATAVLTNVTVTGNSIGNHGGGGIASDTNGLAGTTTLILNNVTVTNNTASSDGGGIFLDASSTSSALTDVTVLDNTAPGMGGGIAEDGGTATLSGSTIDDNTASTVNTSLGGGLYVAGTLTVSDSTVNGNNSPFYGGGIDVEGGNLTLINTTVADNSAGGVGGLNNGLNATTTLEEVTISGNSTVGGASSAATAPGGVASQASQGGVLIASNSIIAQNSNALDGTNYPDVTGQFTSLGHNLIGAIDNSSGWSGSDLTGTVASPLNADLGVLTDNGGATKTLSPLTGSPAVGAGLVALIPAGVKTDQRGFGRTVNGLVDIGAVEVGGAVVTSAASVTTVTASAQTVLVQNADTFTITVSPADASGPTPTGTISIYQDGTFKGAYSLVAGAVTQSITAGKAIASTVFTIVYGGDANYTASTSSSVTQTYLSKSAITGKIGKAIEPVTAISGQKSVFRVPVTLTNTGPAVKGNFTETLYLDSSSVSDSALGANPVQLAKVIKHTTLKAGKSFAVLLGVNALPASLAAGTYHLVVKTTDLYGDVDLATLDRTITVAAPFVAIAPTVGPVKPPIVVIDGKGSVVVTIVNQGNVTAAGFLVLTFSPSSDGITPLPGFVLTRPTFHVSIKPGKSGKYTLKFKVPVPLTAGVYYPLVTASLGQVTTTAVGAQFTAG